MIHNSYTSFKHYKIPGFSKEDYRIFQLDGQSMVPTLSSDDQIVCSRIHKLNKIADGTMVVIVTNEEALVKRLCQSGDGETYQLKSDNGDFKVYSLRKENIKEALAGGS